MSQKATYKNWGSSTKIEVRFSQQEMKANEKGQTRKRGWESSMKSQVTSTNAKDQGTRTRHLVTAKNVNGWPKKEIEFKNKREVHEPLDREQRERWWNLKVWQTPAVFFWIWWLKRLFNQKGIKVQWNQETQMKFDEKPGRHWTTSGSADRIGRAFRHRWAEVKNALMTMAVDLYINQWSKKTIKPSEIKLMQPLGVDNITSWNNIESDGECYGRNGSC